MDHLGFLENVDVLVLLENVDQLEHLDLRELLAHLEDLPDHQGHLDQLEVPLDQ